MKASEKSDTMLDELLRAGETGAPSDGACAPSELWHALALGALDEENAQRLRSHAELCARCAAEQELARAFERPASEHEAVAIDQILQRVDGKRQAPAAQVIEFSPARGSAPTTPSSRRRASVPQWLGLAAGLLTVVLASAWFFAQREALPPLRPPGDGAVLRSERSIELLAPVGEVAELPDEFRWRATTELVNSFRLTVTRVDGRHVFQATRPVGAAGSGEEHVMPLLAEHIALLQAHVTYRWQVVGIEAGGREVEASAEGEFLVRPHSPQDSNAAGKEEESRQ